MVTGYESHGGGRLTRIDRYEVLGELASGGMGVVYLAKRTGDQDAKKRYALKRIHKHLASDRVFIDMFRDEVNLAARIHHPNVVNIVEFGQADGIHHVVMDYVDGVTVLELYDGALPGTIPHGVAIRIALDALHGLHAAHEAKDDVGAPLNVVHRDVTPQNILVGVDGSARLTDFGIARASSRLTVTRTGEFKGKIRYMAPEQMGLGDVIEIDRRVDVFALGTVLWELLTGERLFKAESDVEAIDRVLHAEIPTARSRKPALPESIDAVVQKALARNRDERYPTALAFADALEAAARPTALIASQSDSRDAVARCPRPERPGSWVVEKTKLLESAPSSRTPNRSRAPAAPAISPTTRTTLGMRVSQLVSLALFVFAAIALYRHYR